MGGTSTDVSQFDGEYQHVFETNIAGIVLQNPQLEIQTVRIVANFRWLQVVALSSFSKMAYLQWDLK